MLEDEEDIRGRGSPFTEDIRIIYVHPREVIELHLHGLLDRIVHTINYTKRYRGLSINTLNSKITPERLSFTYHTIYHDQHKDSPSTRNLLGPFSSSWPLADTLNSFASIEHLL